MARSYSYSRMVTLSSSSSTSKLTEQVAKTADDKPVVIKTVTDDGAGGFLNSLGTVDYSGKAVSLKVVAFDRSTESYKSDYENATEFAAGVNSDGAGSWNNSGKKGGAYSTASVGEELFAGSSLVARYRVGSSSPSSHTETYTPPVVEFDLCPTTAQRIVPGSVQFAWMGSTYQDFEGKVYRGRTDVSPGTESGAIDYATGHVLMTDYVVGGSGPADFTLQSLWTAAQDWNTASLFFNTDAAPLRAGAGGLVLTVNDTTGAQLTANVGALGQITGTHMWGTVDFSRGGVQLQFGDFVLDSALTAEEKLEWWYSAADVGTVEAEKIWRPWPVLPETMRYSCVSFIYLPVDVSLMGIDPAALPPDGRVAFARPGDTCVIGVTHGGSAFSPSLTTYDTGHERLSFVQVLDAATGAEIRTGYTADLDAGTVTFADISGYPASIKVVAREEVYRQIAEVRIDGSVRLTQPIGKAFGTDAIFSTALRQGDRFARVSRLYDQASWNGSKWTDGVDPAIGDAAATYNATQHPIVVTNAGAITERWAIKIRAGGTLFDLSGQHLGVIASGSINEDFAPVNTAASAPYFSLAAIGWGSGWVAGNTLFFDTVGAEAPLDLVRCTMPSTPAGIDDSFWLVQRGDVGREPESDFD